MDGQALHSDRPDSRLHSGTAKADVWAVAVGATQAVAFELDARLVPQRSEDQDPLRLHVGDLVLHRMQLARPGIFRFILADRSRVPEGAAVSIQDGDDDSTRVVVDPVLRIPWN